MRQTPRRGDSASPARPPRRTRYADLGPRATFSRTSPPTVDSDLALWGGFADVPVEQLDLNLFDDRGRPIVHRLHGGRS